MVMEYFCKGCGNRMVHVEGNGSGEGGREWMSVAAARVVGFD